jgi:hypothetical protein
VLHVIDGHVVVHLHEITWSCRSTSSFQYRSSRQVASTRLASDGTVNSRLVTWGTFDGAVWFRYWRGHPGLRHTQRGDNRRAALTLEPSYPRRTALVSAPRFVDLDCLARTHRA